MPNYVWKLVGRVFILLKTLLKRQWLRQTYTLGGGLCLVKNQKSRTFEQIQGKEEFGGISENLVRRSWVSLNALKWFLLPILLIAILCVHMIFLVRSVLVWMAPPFSAGVPLYCRYPGELGSRYSWPEAHCGRFWILEVLALSYFVEHTN